VLAGANFEIEDVAPVLSRTGLFDMAMVRDIDRWVRRTWWFCTRKRTVEVMFAGRTERIRITCFKDDIRSPDISFRGAEEVVAIIEKAISAYRSESNS
jgi:hypothetical protein